MRISPGETEHARALASGQERRQLGLKLRAANGCNLVYVIVAFSAPVAAAPGATPGATAERACREEDSD